MPLIYFNLEREDTRLIRSNNTVYKIKILPKASFTLPCNVESAHDQIENVLRSLLYMDQRSVILKPIHTADFIVTAVKKAWKTCKTLNFYLHRKPIKACPYQFILKVDVKKRQDNETQLHPIQSDVEELHILEVERSTGHPTTENILENDSRRKSLDFQQKSSSKDQVDSKQIVEVYKKTHETKDISLDDSLNKRDDNVLEENKKINTEKILEKIRKRERQKQEVIKRKQEVEELFLNIENGQSPLKKVRKLYKANVFCKTPGSAKRKRNYDTIKARRSLPKTKSPMNTRSLQKKPDLKTEGVMNKSTNVKESPLSKKKSRKVKGEVAIIENDKDRLSSVDTTMPGQRKKMNENLEQGRIIYKKAWSPQLNKAETTKSSKRRSTGTQSIESKSTGSSTQSIESKSNVLKGKRPDMLGNKKRIKSNTNQMILKGKNSKKTSRMSRRQSLNSEGSQSRTSPKKRKISPSSSWESSRLRNFGEMCDDTHNSPAKNTSSKGSSRSSSSKTCSSVKSMTKKKYNVRSKSLSTLKKNNSRSTMLEKNDVFKKSPKADLFRPLKSSGYESDRLEKLRTSSHSTHSRPVTYNQLDRHVVESEDIEESMKLQTMSKSKTPPSSPCKSPRKKSSFWGFVDAIITPVKEVLKG